MTNSAVAAAKGLNVLDAKLTVNKIFNISSVIRILQIGMKRDLISEFYLEML